MDTLMHMIHDGNYEMTLPVEGWARLWRVEKGVANDLLKELFSLGVTLVEERSDNGLITLVSRRVLKDAIRRVLGRMRKARHDGRRPGNADVTLLERLKKRLGNVQITPDTQILRCLDAQKLRKKQLTTTPAPAGAALNGGAVWGRWVDVNRAAGNPDPVPDGPDIKAAKRLAHVLAGDEVVALLDAYLADKDQFVAKQGHALRLLPGRINAYRNTPAEAAPQMSAEALAMAEKLEREIQAAGGRKSHTGPMPTRAEREAAKKGAGK